jgi:hypothetical protein
MLLQRQGDVFPNRKGKGAGLLKDHSDLFPQPKEIGVGFQDVVLSDPQCAAYLTVGGQIRHAIEAVQERSFSAAGGPNQGRDAAAIGGEIYV